MSVSMTFDSSSSDVNGDETVGDYHTRFGFYNKSNEKTRRQKKRRINGSNKHDRKTRIDVKKSIAKQKDWWHQNGRSILRKVEIGRLAVSCSCLEKHKCRGAVPLSESFLFVVRGGCRPTITRFGDCFARSFREILLVRAKREGSSVPIEILFCSDMFYAVPAGLPAEFLYLMAKRWPSRDDDEEEGRGTTEKARLKSILPGTSLQLSNWMSCDAHGSQSVLRQRRKQCNTAQAHTPSKRKPVSFLLK